MDDRPGDDGSAPAGAAPGRLLGRGYQGEVHLVETPSGPVIVKQPIGRGPARALRVAMLRRERAIYRLLDGIAGVPRCLDGDAAGEGEALVLEYVSGRSLREARLPAAERERFFEALRVLIEAVHRAGVGHGDLKRKDNIIVGADGRPYLIDFGTALSAPPGSGAARRWLLRQVQRMDLNAWFKLKYQRQGGDVSPTDIAAYRPTALERLARLVRRGWRSLTLRRLRKSRGRRPR
jgi:predicted Ser/Thr protein kinase